jgi:hypothetical protein
MKPTITLILLLFTSCQHYELNKFNRQLRSLDKYIERNERKAEKQQRELKQEIKGQRK